MSDDDVRAAIKDCVHCGFCLPACPTYQLWGEEMDSPRGRIHLASQILDGASLTAAAAEHFDRCLGCMACVTACPSGVRYDQIIEAARVWTEEPYEAAPIPPDSPDSPVSPGARAGGVRRSLRDRATRAAIFAVFPYPRRLRALTAPLRVARRAGLDRALTRSGLPARVSPAAEAALRLAPASPALPAGRLPSRVPALGTRRAVVGMLTGCVQSVFFPQVNAATARVLAAEGCDVIIPRGQGCCGALSLHSGRAEEAIRFAKRTIATFEAAGVDAIIVNSAGCGSAMKEYERLFSDQAEVSPSWASRAAALSAQVRDLAEFLAELGTVAPRHPLPVTAAYHDACHLGHAQRITRQPRELLRAIPGLTLVDLRDAGTCCGSAGVYNLLQPEAAHQLGARKADSVLDSGASLVISANPGCTLQISAELASRGRSVATAHTAEVLDASIRGLPLTSLRVNMAYPRHGRVPCRRARGKLDLAVVPGRGPVGSIRAVAGMVEHGHIQHIRRGPYACGKPAEARPGNGLASRLRSRRRPPADRRRIPDRDSHVREVPRLDPRRGAAHLRRRTPPHRGASRGAGVAGKLPPA